MDSLISGVLTSGSTVSTTPASKNSPEKIHEAATQFESLLIGQILKSAHEEEGGWLGTGEDQTAGSAMGLADEYLAQAMSKRGGFGLAKSVSAGLLKSVNSSNPSTQPPPAHSVSTQRTDR
jgi:Rod binding domain-containing protein